MLRRERGPGNLLIYSKGDGIPSSIANTSTDLDSDAIVQIALPLIYIYMNVLQRSQNLLVQFENWSDRPEVYCRKYEKS